MLRNEQLGLDITYLGEPFCQIGSAPGLDDVSYLGEPFSITYTAKASGGPSEVSGAFSRSGSKLISQAQYNETIISKMEIYADASGAVSLLGANAARFEISLNGSTYSSTQQVGPGTTQLYIKCTPLPGDGKLLAQLEIP